MCLVVDLVLYPSPRHWVQETLFAHRSLSATPLRRPATCQRMSYHAFPFTIIPLFIHTLQTNALWILSVALPLAVQSVVNVLFIRSWWDLHHSTLGHTSFSSLFIYLFHMTGQCGCPSPSPGPSHNSSRSPWVVR
ncbi:hypothetical protein L210DRAFT_2004102 [Boletus edulis BED1]|uniref:Uncharacterized protein n=1 Tax=Boletus edulis BED1 TaxID=1328754 RepID=A0AAD4C812_BOLED|nr:hypothetical protein L210DRAFT_2004102 [Boletus edulis BED1]